MVEKLHCFIRQKGFLRKMAFLYNHFPKYKENIMFDIVLETNILVDVL